VFGWWIGRVDKKKVPTSSQRLSTYNDLASLRSSIDEIIRQLRVGESSKRAENKRREKVSLTRKILHRFLGLISIHRGNESEKCFLSSVSYAISGCGFIRYCAIAARLGQKLSQRRSILPYKFQLTNSIDQLVNTRKTHMK